MIVLPTAKKKVFSSSASFFVSLVKVGLEISFEGTVWCMTFHKAPEFILQLCTMYLIANIHVGFFRPTLT